jgi:beta-lactam-binding protein with PASTA domain
MNYEARPNAHARQPSVVPVAIITSLLTSLVVTAVVLGVTGNLGLPGSDTDEEAGKKLKVIKVPAVIGLTPEVAGDVVRARNLRLLVSGEREDDKVEKGRIVEQDPMDGSDLNTDGAIKVVVSSGVKKVEIPPIVGKPVEEAKQLLTSLGLTVADVNETGEGEPGTVTDATPKPGEIVEKGHAVTLTASPAGVVVPDVVGKYVGKAKKELEEAGFEKGEVKWRYNEYQDANVVLSQEPEAGAMAPPGSAINLVVNEED